MYVVMLELNQKIKCPKHKKKKRKTETQDGGRLNGTMLIFSHDQKNYN